MPPLVVVHGEQSLRAVVEALRREGWEVQPGWELEDGGWDARRRRLVFTGAIDGPDAAAAALLAASRGAGIVAAAPSSPDLLARFLDDLRRLGRVEYRPPDRPERPTLTPEQRRLLEELSRGTSMAEAARRLHISKRTAERRLATAKVALGARTTTEALVKLDEPESSEPEIRKIGGDSR